jgi:co-chaperonin GroES (HSP10)
MTFQVIGERLLVRPFRQGERKVGRLILPATSAKMPDMGVIIKVGQDEKDTFKVRPLLSELFYEGQQIIFQRYAGMTVEIEQQKIELVVIDRADVLLAIMEDHAPEPMQNHAAG